MSSINDRGRKSESWRRGVENATAILREKEALPPELELVAQFVEEWRRGRLIEALRKGEL